MAKVWFVGAGSGDPELITLKAHKLIQQADTILVANPLLIDTVKSWSKAEAKIAEAEQMTVAQITEWLLEKAHDEMAVVFLQSDDFDFSETLIETMQVLEAAGIAIGVVPGVPSAIAMAAAACESLTLANVTQSVVFTRLKENTPMPEGESLRELAQHQCALCIYSAVELLEIIQESLLNAGWEDDAAVLVANQTDYSNQKIIIRGTLTDIKEKCVTAKISGQIIVIISPALGMREWLGK